MKMTSTKTLLSIICFSLFAQFPTAADNPNAAAAGEIAAIVSGMNH